MALENTGGIAGSDFYSFSNHIATNSYNHPKNININIKTTILLAAHYISSRALSKLVPPFTLLLHIYQKIFGHTHPKEPARRFLPSMLPEIKADILVFKIK